MGGAAVDDRSKSVHANNSFHEIRKQEDDDSNFYIGSMAKRYMKG